MNVKTTEVKNENVERTVKTTEVNKLLIELQNYIERTVKTTEVKNEHIERTVKTMKVKNEHIERTVKTKEVNKLLIELQNYIICFLLNYSS